MSGLVTMTPTSIDHVGTSASINANGGVDFEGVTSLSLDGVFTGGDEGFDNYVIMFYGLGTSTGYETRARLRISGTDTSDSDYYSQLLEASGTSVPPYRYSAQNFAVLSATDKTAYSGASIAVYGPALAQPTAMRSVSVYSNLSGRIFDSAVTHSVSTSYDGITIYPVSGAVTGNVTVMGYAE